MEDKKSFFGLGNQSRFYEVGKTALFWKLSNFLVDPADLASQERKARSFQNVILDLRGNSGGRTDALEAFLGAFFDHDVTIGEDKGRKTSKKSIAKGHGSGAIGGKLIVLIDSNTASAAEIFSRVVQLQKRGTVLGDRSSGAVMKSQQFFHAVSLDPNNVTQYRAMVTIGNQIMADGKSLEGVGVTPDERILPTPADLATGRDR